MGKLAQTQMGVRRVVVAAAFAVDYNISTTTTTTGQQQHKLLSKRCHLLPFGVVGVCRKGRHLSHSSRKHCLRRIFSTFVVVVWAAAAAQWVTHLTLTKTKISMQQQKGNNNKWATTTMDNELNVEYFVLIGHTICLFLLFIASSRLFYCPMPTELIAQIICFFGQSLRG